MTTHRLEMRDILHHHLGSQLCPASPNDSGTPWSDPQNAIMTIQVILDAVAYHVPAPLLAGVLLPGRPFPAFLIRLLISCCPSKPTSATSSRQPSLSSLNERGTHPLCPYSSLMCTLPSWPLK